MILESVSAAAPEHDAGSAMVVSFHLTSVDQFGRTALKAPHTAQLEVSPRRQADVIGRHVPGYDQTLQPLERLIPSGL